MKRLKVILLEASLELAPPSWPRGPLIDKRYHYHHLSNYSQKWKRGRPDIVHITALILQDSILNKMGMMELYVHTIEGRVFKIREDERLPKHYEAFKEIMAQLLEKGKVPPDGEPLIWEAYRSLSDFVKEHGKLILLWEGGERKTFREVAEEAIEEGLPVGIGVFPRGDFRRSVLNKALKRYKVYDEPLKAWTVACRLVGAAEELLGVL